MRLAVYCYLQKLAALLDVEDSALRQQLCCLKAKAQQLKWAGGVDATQGKAACGDKPQLHHTACCGICKDTVLVD